MQLKLYENIKKFRKEKELTQEKLAEILGVTVGTVSKWENANNTPDIMMLATLAELFDVSIDALLGYDVTPKKINDIVDAINSCAISNRFDEAINISKDALMRYPHDFSVIYASAMIYHVMAVQGRDKRAPKEAIRLFELAKEYLRQNDNSEINEYTINCMIATDYMLFDVKKALRIFKENNFGGVNNALISTAYMEEGDIKEALDYSTRGLMSSLFGLFNSSINMILSLSFTGKKKDIESALILCDDNLNMIGMFSNDEEGYFDKFKALFLVIKAYLYGLMKDEKMSGTCLESAKTVARRYDENDSNDLAKDLKFYYSKKETYYAVDSIGDSAVKGIGAFLSNQITNIKGLDKKLTGRLFDSWNEA